MAKRGNVNRLLNPTWGSARNAQWALWDEKGRKWSLRTYGIDRPRFEELYFDPKVSVAVAEGTRGPIWIAPDERRQRWAAEIEQRAFGTWSWKAKRSLPLVGLEFSRQDDSLLVLYDED